MTAAVYEGSTPPLLIRSLLPWIITEQKISQMDDPDPVDIAGSQFVESYHIFRIVILDLKKIRDFPV